VLKALVSGLGEGVDVGLQVLPCFFDLELELVLEGEERIVGAFGLVGDVLFAALYLAAWYERYRSIS
jgi:hypothetical protein